MFDRFTKIRDIRKLKKILQIQDDNVKDFFDTNGCGLEIEFGVTYIQESIAYTKTGLKKLKDIVGNNGKFVLDETIGEDLNVEIVLNPFSKEKLIPLVNKIIGIINFYENFRYTEKCGVHANFRADDKMKEEFYYILANGGYHSEKFDHNKYKVDFMDIVKKDDGSIMTYEEYIGFQHEIGAKYVAVNFLKKDLVEFRALNLNTENIEYVIDLFDEARQNHEKNIG
ncbi:MAG: hypothetical protein E7218_08375 [Anaerofustis stercorihominis]|nr:hypothetical protein [Anaerofustis stercorihominis]